MFDTFSIGIICDCIIGYFIGSYFGWGWGVGIGGFLVVADSFFKYKGWLA